MKKRSDGRYRIKFTTEDGKTHYAYGKTVQEAKASEVAMRKRISDGLIDNDNITLDKYFEIYDEQRKGTVRESTARVTRQHYQALSRHIGKMKLAKISRPVVIKLQKDLQTDKIIRNGKDTGKTYTEKGVNDRISLLYSIMKSAVADRIIKYNPVEGIKYLQKTTTPARDTIHRALTEKEIDIFFEAAKSSWYYNLFRFLVCSGCRTCEATALSEADIDYKKNVIHINKTVQIVDNKTSGEGEPKYKYIIFDKPKTTRSRRDIPLTEDLKEVIRDQKKMINEFFDNNILSFDRLLFVNQKGNLITSSDGNQAIRNVLHYLPEDKKIDKFTDHAFRDTFATQALRSGMNPNTLKEILGHASLSMTMDLYGHVLEDTKADEMGNVRIFG